MLDEIAGNLFQELVDSIHPTGGTLDDILYPNMAEWNYCGDLCWLTNEGIKSIRPNTLQKTDVLTVDIIKGAWKKLHGG